MAPPPQLPARDRKWAAGDCWQIFNWQNVDAKQKNFNWFLKWLPICTTTMMYHHAVRPQAAFLSKRHFPLSYTTTIKNPAKIRLEWKKNTMSLILQVCNCLFLDIFIRYCLAKYWRFRRGYPRFYRVSLLGDFHQLIDISLFWPGSLEVHMIEPHPHQRLN